MTPASLQKTNPAVRAVLCALAAASAFMTLGAANHTASAAGVGESDSFHGPTGLQLYSLRNVFKEKGVEETLDLVKDWGFNYVEVAGTYGMSTPEFRAELDKRGLVAIGSHFPYNRLKTDIDGVIQDAKELGVEYNFIEDESPTVVEQIPQSLKFLEALEL